jgi:salicylate hydroxylase
MAIEDAATLGSLFSYLNDRLKIPTLLSAYEDIRQTRCAEMQASERSMTNFVSHPRGSAERVRRDAGFQDALAHDVLELEDAAEEVVASSLADYVAHWGYDAYEAVDDWWTKWGWSDPIPPAIPIPISNARARGYSVTEVNMRVEKIKAVGI